MAQATRIAAAGGVALCVLAVPVSAGEATDVAARYEVTFAGFEVGKIYFNSTIRDGRYEMTGHAKLRAGFGAWKWKGQIKSQGTISNANRVLPVEYSYDYKRNKKSAQLTMMFSGNQVSGVTAAPAVVYSHRHVPVTEKHKAGVLDPLSAMLQLTSTTPVGSDPCNRTIAVFDGKERFELRFALKRRAKLERQAGYGLDSTAFVCSAEYIPVAGHKRDRAANDRNEVSGAEVWMVAAPRANAHVPIRMVLPTPAGTAYVETIDLKINSASTVLATLN